jgi:hypothetical protein
VVEASLFDSEMRPRVLYSYNAKSMAEALSLLLGKEIQPSSLSRCVGSGATQKRVGDRCYLLGVCVRAWDVDAYKSDKQLQAWHAAQGERVETKLERRRRHAVESQSRKGLFQPVVVV